ncbi:MAG: S8 family serine peptidase [Longimicrobiales bacterium]|nr:S8 family serine peptidase [Longimicrobiales bacterium]
MCAVSPLSVPLFLFAALLQAAPAATQEPVRRPVLFKDSRGEIAHARVRGEADILLVIASMPGRNAEVARAIADLGGKVQYREDAVDYLRARVPLDAIERLMARPALHSADVSMGENRSRTLALADGAGVVPPALPAAIPDRPDTVPALPDTIREVWPPVLSDYPIRNRYSPLGDMRALTFLAENPTYDGRGVTVAMIDMNPDMLLPELQVAKSLDGTSIPKIAIYETALDRDEEHDGRWLFMDDMVEAVGGRFAYGDTTYTAPRDGTFRIALFDEKQADSLSSSGLKGDINRDGNPEGSSRLFAVLWDEAAGDVWVDTNQDLSFVGETALGDYEKRPVFGVFGTDSLNTAVRESIGFGVQIDKDRKRVAINLGVASHASLVVGAAVGSRGEKGRFDGMAPGARLASVSEGGAAYGQTEATIKAAQHPEVDVLYFEQSSYITRTYLPRDGRLVPSVINDRLTAKYGVSIVSPTHNYPVLGAIDDIVMGRGTIGIGGHEGKDNFFVNHGVRVEHDDNLLITGGYGPMGDGSLKPDILAPSNYVSTAQGFVEGRAIPGLYQLPPGYTIAGGTSTATPTATGGVALLISAARQAGIKHDPERIKWAVTRSGRWVPHIAAYMQGNGVFNVAGAWDILKKLNDVPSLLAITSRAPVRHPFSHLLPTPNEGVGLYEREGWEPGKRQERTLTFTRTNGPGQPMTFDLSWAGNDHGAFSAPLSVTLPLNRPVPVTLAVEPPGFGVFTAHLTLSHPDVPGYAYRTTATVVASEPLNAANQYKIRKETKVPRPGMQSFFFQVPEGASALKVELGWTDRQASLTVVRPDTRQTRGDAVLTQAKGVVHVVWNPMPGMWEVRLTDVGDTQTFDWQQAKKLEPVPPTPATLTISTLSVEMGQVWGSPGGAAPPHPVGDFEVTLANRMAEFKGGAVSTPVASARLQTLEMAEKEQKVSEVEVLPGSTALMARAFSPSDPGADVDVYVFDCTSDPCKGAKVDADPVGDEWVTVPNPAPGKWKIVVDLNTAPSGRTTFQYLDAVLNPTYGMLTVTDVPQERAGDARWNARAHLWVAPAAHVEGRVPMPALGVEAAGPGETTFWLGLDALIPPPPPQPAAAPVKGGGSD